MIRVDESNDHAAEILFFLPDAVDPSIGKTGHSFVAGEVQIRPPGTGAFIDVVLTDIIERGFGWYAIRLTTAQRATAGECAYRAVCAGAQPDRGTETIGTLGGDIAQNAIGAVPFYLPNASDPVNGAPIEGHTFTLGEVKISLPDGAFADAALSSIVEYGGGLYGVSLTATQTAKRGKVIIYADVAGSQRFSTHRTILSSGASVQAAPPPVPEPLSGGELARVVSGDLALTWSNTTANADISRLSDDSDLLSDQGLKTAVEISLFTDRRAAPDDIPSSGDDRDRRGWWGDQFLDVEGDRYGSRLWLLARSKLTANVASLADEYIREALAWMIEDRVVSEIDVTVETTETSLLFAVGLQQPGRDQVSFQFSHAWDHVQEGN